MTKLFRSAACLAALLLSGAAYAHQGAGSCDTSAEGCNAGVADNFYPATAIRRGLEGAVTVSVLVDTAGHARDCRIVKSSGHNILDAAACRRIEALAHFRPAEDHAGNQVNSRTELTMNWKLPETNSEAAQQE